MANRCLSCGRRTPAVVSFNGMTVRTYYCPDCVCLNTAAGQTCLFPRSKWPQSTYCVHHLRCTHAGCANAVKDGNPKTFKFCNHHSCTAPHCPDRRETGSSFCAAHKCIRPGCNDGRHPSGRSRYCAKHTCESADCGNLVVHDGDSVPAGDPRRFCDMHKRCSRADCVRHCYMRDDGSMAKFCGEHRCHSKAGACDKERDGGEYCADHTCQWRWGQGQCRNGFANEAGGSRFCSDHECARADCRELRDRYRGEGSTFCSQHKCREWRCAKEVHGETEWCERHQPCSHDGCQKKRVMDGERVTEHCEKHTPPNCAWPQPKCSSKPVDHGRFCSQHTCAVPDCVEERDATVRRSQACADHRCTVENCPAVRQAERAGFGLSGNYCLSLTVAHTYCPTHGCQARGGRCTSQAMADGSRFCKRHSCAVQDCPDEARERGSKFCLEHATTRQERIAAAARGLYPAAAGMGIDPGVYGAVPPLLAPPPGVYGGMEGLPTVQACGYGFGMGMPPPPPPPPPPPVVPGGGMMGGVGYPVGPGQTRYQYQF